jgi:hypothetical protein
MRVCPNCGYRQIEREAKYCFFCNFPLWDLIECFLLEIFTKGGGNHPE